MKPFKEVLLFSNIKNYYSSLEVKNTTNYSLKTNAVTILWRGSVDKFKKDFELPTDSPLSTKDITSLNGDSAEFVTNWNLTTLNFKFNYQIWYKDGHGSNADNYYVLGSNNTINLTIPNVLLFNGAPGSGGLALKYSTSPNVHDQRIYNPNIFPIPVTISSFTTSNKTNDFQSISGYGTNSLFIYLVFRYGVGGDDIQICLVTRNESAMQVNNQPLIMPYASLTFTGFNKIKKLG